jgi:single-strand DNA-binding protein
MAGEPTVTVVGNVGSDPEVRFMSDGTAVCNFSIAVTESKLKDTKWIDGDTTWFRVSVWRKFGETVAEAVTKGQRLVIVGKLKISEYEKDGEKRMRPEITADTLGIVPKATQKTNETKTDDGSPW